MPDDSMTSNTVVNSDTTTVNIGDTLTFSFTGADMGGVYASALIKVTKIQTEPVVVITGDQQ